MRKLIKINRLDKIKELTKNMKHVKLYSHEEYEKLTGEIIDLPEDGKNYFFIVGKGQNKKFSCLMDIPDHESLEGESKDRFLYDVQLNYDIEKERN